MKGSIAELLKPYLFGFLGRGVLLTLEIALTTIVLGFVMGTLLGIMRYTKHPVLGRIAGIYVEVFRNLPLILLILAARFMSGLEPMTSVITALTIYTAAVMAEIVRGGLTSVPLGQWEAAKSQGFTYLQTLRHIALPQALRKMVPPIVSQFTTVIKDSAFGWIVSVEELTGKGVIISGQYGSTAQFFAVFGFVGLIYFVLNFVLTRAARQYERRLAI